MKLLLALKSASLIIEEELCNSGHVSPSLLDELSFRGLAPAKISLRIWKVFRSSAVVQEGPSFGWKPASITRQLSAFY